MKKIKVMHIISDTNVGGAGKLLYNLCKAIDSRRFDLMIVLPRGSDLIKLFLSMGPNVTVYCIDHGQDRSFSLKASLEVSRLIRNKRPDIIHTHSALYGRIGAKFASFDTKKVIYTKHCVFALSRIRTCRIVKKCYEWIDDRLAGNIVAVAESAKKELVDSGIRPQKIQVIINGSLPQKKVSDKEKEELKKELGINDGAFIVGMSARLEEYKGHKTMIRAAEIIKKQGSDQIVFLVLGSGSIENELKEYAKKHNVEDIILFLGFKNNVNEYVNLFDVNLNCSTGTETSSLAISEGLSLGKVALASDYGGNPNMVINGKTGFVFRQNDEVELSEKILLLKNNPSVLQYMSERAKEDFDSRFSADIMARQYGDLYNIILQQK